MTVLRNHFNCGLDYIKGERHMSSNKPFPSADLDVFHGNSLILDHFVNSLNDEYPDRLGRMRPTITGIIKEAFNVRTDINNMNETLIGQSRWDGVPKNTSLALGGDNGSLNKQAQALFNRTVMLKAHAREALRRTYLETGLNLVEGSFEEGAVITSTTDVVLHEKTGKCYSGPIGEVPKGTDPLIGGFIDMGEASNILAETLNFNTFSLGYTSLDNAFIDFIAECNAKGKTAVGNLTGVTLTTPIQINVPYRFTGVLTITGSGRLDFSNETTQVLSVIQSQFTKGQKIIPSLVGKTGMINIRTTSKLLSRYQISETVHYGEVNYVVDGVLNHQLNDDYSTLSGFSVEFIPASNKPTQHLAIAISSTDTTGHLLTFSGSNFHVDAELIQVNNPAVYSNFMRFNKAHSFSYTPTILDPMGSRNLIAYDSYLLTVYGVDIINPAARNKEGWKTIDGTDYRRVRVIGGDIYAMHSHWNGCDVTVLGTRSEKAFSFASHISDGTYDIDANILNDSSFVGMRADYGFLAGTISTKGILNHNGGDGALVKLVHDMHTDQNNVGVVFIMPKSIKCDVKVIGGVTNNELSLVETRNDIIGTNSIKPWTMLSGRVDYSEFAGTLVLRSSITTSTSHTYKVRLKDFIDNGRPMRLELGNQSSSITIPNNVVMDCELKGMKVSCNNGETLRRILLASGRVLIADSTIIDYMNTINTYSVPSGCIIEIENCRWEFTAANHWTNSSLMAKYTTLNNVTFDGAKIPAPLYTKGGFWVSTSRGCKAINLDLETTYASYYPDSGVLNQTVKKMAPINPRGGKDTFDNQYVSTI